MSATAGLSPPVALRLGAWLAGAVERSHTYTEHVDESFAVVLIGGPAEWRATWTAEAETLEEAILKALDAANGGGA